MQSELSTVKPVHEKFIELTKKKVEGKLKEGEASSLQEEVDDSSKTWQNISKQTESRQKSIDKLMKPAKKFNQKEGTFASVLKELERRSNELDLKAIDYRDTEGILKDSKVSRK